MEEDQVEQFKAELKRILLEGYTEPFQEMIQLNRQVGNDLRDLAKDMSDYHKQIDANFREMAARLRELEQRVSMLEQKVFGRVN